MPTIRITELETAAIPSFEIKVQIALGKELLAPRWIHHPLNQAEREELNWYFERYQNEPYETDVRAQQCEKIIYSAGERLFEQIFSLLEDYKRFQNFMKKNAHKEINLELEGNSSAFHSIPWEHIKDPNLINPLCINGVHIFRCSKGGEKEILRRTVSKLRMLLVTARPGFDRDINARTIQRPVIQLLNTGHFPVEVTIIRPGTLPALLECLDTQDRKKPFDIIHFDLHGAIRTYQQLMNDKAEHKLQFQQFYFGETQHRIGIPDNLSPFQGKKPFLFFEGEEINKPVPIDAYEMAAILEARNIPICIFNACQSAGQHDEDIETSLGKVLVSKIPNVLALRYSVSVDAATILIEEIYNHLFAGKGLEKAVTKARKKLFQDRNRSAAFGMTVSMGDWVLPVMYSEKEVHFKLKKQHAEEWREAVKAEKAARWEEPKHGFCGRDLDIISVERFFVLPPKRHLLMRGLRGVGITSFLQHLAYWWEKTSFTTNSIYINAKEQLNPQNIEQLYAAIADKLINPNDRSVFESLPVVVKREKLLRMLNSERCALLIDHILKFESKDIIQFLNDIKGMSMVIHTASVPSEIAGDDALRVRHYTLKGLDENATATLLNRILSELKPGLTSGGITKEPTERFALRKLLSILDGHPEAMLRVLLYLDHLKPSELLKLYENAKI